MRTATTEQIRTSARPDTPAGAVAVARRTSTTGHLDGRSRRPRRVGRRLLCGAAALLGLVLLGACGDRSNGTAPLDVEAALSVEDGTEVTVVGFVRYQGLTWLSADLLHDLDRFELCDVLVMSESGDGVPTLEICGGGTIELAGVDQTGFEMIGHDVTTGGGEEYWTPEQVILTGTIDTTGDDRVLTVDRVEDVSGEQARIATGVAQSIDSTGPVELTVRAFRAPTGEVTVCDGFLVGETGARHPFTDEPILEPTGCAEPALRVTNPDALAELRFVPSGAADGAHAPELALVSGEIDASGDRPTVRVTEVIARS